MPLRFIFSANGKSINTKIFTLYRLSCKLAANLDPVWASGDYYQKQMFQNVLFPNGLLYDVKIEHYRTPIINSAISCIADLSKGLTETKNGTSQNVSKKSRSVSQA